MSSCEESCSSDEESEKEIELNPWGRFFALWLICGLASTGMSLGLMLYVDFFVEAGVFGSDPENQFTKVSATLSSGMQVSLMATLPVGIMYDRFGARMLGAVGCLICAAGVASMWLSVVGAQAGQDAQYNFMLLVGCVTTDLGTVINSYAMMGLLWHFPEHQTLLLAIVGALYQAASFIPLFLKFVMATFNIGFGSVLLAYALAIVPLTYAVWVLTPPQIDFFRAAEAAMGMPLPDVPETFTPKQLCKDLCAILKMHWKEHLLAGIALSLTMGWFSFYMPTMWQYGDALFGEGGGETIGNVYVSICLILGFTVAPLGGVVADKMGFKSIPMMLMGLEVLAVVTAGVAQWWVQYIGVAAQALLSAFFMLMTNRYFLLYAPPEQFGTTLGLYLFVVMNFSMIFSMWAISATTSGGLNDFKYPNWAFAAAGIPAWIIYLVYLNNNPPPDTPPLLEQESESHKLEA